MIEENELKAERNNAELLHKLIRKELISDLIFDCLFDAIYLDSRNRPGINIYDLKDGMLLNLMEKYDVERFKERLEQLKLEKEKENNE